MSRCHGAPRRPSHVVVPTVAELAPELRQALPEPSAQPQPGPEPDIPIIWAEDHFNGTISLCGRGVIRQRSAFYFHMKPEAVPFEWMRWGWVRGEWKIAAEGEASSLNDAREAIDRR